MNLIVVRAAYDPDAKVWWVEDSAPLNGLNIEAATIDELATSSRLLSSTSSRQKLRAPTLQSRSSATCIPG